MNELQLGLIGLGVCGVAGVFAYNKWQENRHRRLVERSMPRAHADVLLGDAPAAEAHPPVAVEEDDAPAFVEPAPFADEQPRGRRSERVEPVLSLDEALPAADDEVEAPAPAPAAVEAAMPAEPAAHAPAAAGDEPPEHLVSPVIDYIAAFELVEAVSGEQILASQQELLARVAKPIARVGLNDRSGHWERIAAGGAYRRLRLGLLLADRRGPLGEADLLTFHGAMLNIADELMAVADMPPRDSALAAAIALDRFCAEVDIQVGINVIGKGQPFAGTKIRALAEAAGMVLDSSGRFVRCDEEGHALYTLASQEAAGFTPEAMKTTSTHGLVFLLDVPRVGHGDRAFAQMLELARRMAETLNGVLVDDNRRPLTESMLDPFRRQIGQYQSQLAAKGLPAGGPLALRLFA
ncbi:MAG: cell division protein ZipA C-terminal FtsZ-binding domain-containing protein [Rhodocyclaceae bacterium]|nr:cell division protein ZipA C-terminal FtsZ-binding domain-containing protein [Rhodocyclaceae bacterium]